MRSYPVDMEKYLAIYAQHARTDVPVLKTATELSAIRFGGIGHVNRSPSLTDAVREAAEDQGRRVRHAEASPEVNKKIFWVCWLFLYLHSV